LSHEEAQMTYAISEGRPRRVRSELNLETVAKSANAPSIWSTKEWTEMQAAIIGALKPHAEAWDAVAKALKEHHMKYASPKKGNFDE
jgi:hypothetical protein